jgi:hypothetical protein
MNDKYIFRGAPEERVFGALPAGDYSFLIVEADEPYRKEDKWVMKVRMQIEPSGQTVFYRPWTGTDRNGEERDGIADLLIAVNRRPEPGHEPNWSKLVGAKGRCRLKVEIAKQGSLAGKEVNAVHYLHRPKELEPERYSAQEFDAAKAKFAPPEPDDDLPF